MLASRRILILLPVTILCAFFSACGGGAGATASGGTNPGGGAGTSSGGSGGGSSGSGLPTITLLSPSKIMVGVPLGLVNVYGTNFSSDAQVYIDGSAAQTSDNGSSLQVMIPIAMDNTAATHEFTVRDTQGTSVPAIFAVYSPATGPLPFNALPGYNSEGAPGPPILADINGDGLADAIMAGPVVNNSSPLEIMFGKPDGSLSDPSLIPGVSPGLIAAGDVDGNGTIDLVTTSFDSANNTVISVLLNDGKGNFSQVSSIPYSGNFPESLTLVDIDGDGKPDILFTVEDSLLFLKNLGGGTFAAPQTLATIAPDDRMFLVADFNEDGRPDIAYIVTNPANNEDYLHILLNEGGDSFTDTLPPGISGTAGYFAVGDFNNDGHVDIAMEPEPPYVTASLSLEMFFGQGNGTFIAGPTTAVEQNAFQDYEWVVGDFDHDGFLDLAGVDQDGEPGHVLMLFGDGKGDFTVQPINGPMGWNIASGDVNGDHLPDLLIQDRFGILSVVLGRTDRNFTSLLSLSPSGLGNPPVPTDVTGNGKLDLLVPDGTQYGGVSAGLFYMNQGNGTFTESPGGSGEAFAAADLNGDGFADLIGTDGTDLLIWPGNGDPTFQGSSPIVIAPPSGSGFPNPGFIGTQFKIADMDGDGRPDLVFPNVVLYNDGNFQFTAMAINVGDSNSPFVVGDFNDDGLLDIATGGFTLLGKAGRGFTTITSNGLNMTNGDNPAVGDFNRDGNDDVVFGGDEEPMVIYYSRGDGTFYEQSELSVDVASDFSQAPVVADFNGDGLPDIVACLFLSHDCVVYTNDGQGGFTRSYFASGASTVYASAANWNGDGKLGLALTNYVVDFRPVNLLVVFHN